MKLWIGCIAMLWLVGIGATNALADEKREPRPRFKGVELYSWKTAKGWVYALLTGTNRLKTEDEIKAAQNRIVGEKELAKQLARLAKGEHVSWSHRIAGFAYPPPATIKEIQKWARKAMLKLYVPRQPGC